ncbi:MAG: formylglycine-generating enzyme family protein [Rhodocyclaceae bacterium]|nr:formylglycine-generating enzyme family protein [Rhodocyclaceae bacterium]
MPGWQALQAGPVGFDRFGLYAEFSVGKVVQRCRWMAPGSFRMGSPPDEDGRDNDETLHEVTLTRGYWLADTACTQALWLGAMGNNRSSFQDDPRNPVERVSWLEVQKFLGELNTLVPGLGAGLPTEAQWEYACRAGTQTPFSFGGNITPDQVNYDGSRPYAGASKGEYRQKTVPVASLPPNDWGLYEMHGNVWEWCADWYGDLSANPATDPAGPAEGARRVLRGGAWYYYGRSCRSACRSGDGPGYRSRNIGFRLAPGQTQQARQAGPRADGQGQAEPEPGQAAGGPAGQARRRPKKEG